MLNKKKYWKSVNNANEEKNRNCKKTKEKQLLILTVTPTNDPR